MSNPVEEALERARRHLRLATLEGLEAARALLEAALEAGGIEGADADSAVASLRALIDDWISGVRERGRLIVCRRNLKTSRKVGRHSVTG